MAVTPYKKASSAGKIGGILALGRTSHFRKNLIGYLMVTPLVLSLLVFYIYPIIQSFHISFLIYNGATGRFAGLENYHYVLRDNQFWDAAYNTLYMGVLSIVVGIPVSFTIATLINALPIWKNFYKALYFAPNVTSIIATSIVFMYLFYPTNQGPLNYVLGWLHLEPVGWFTNPRVARIGIILMDLWHGIGYSMLIWLAGLQSVRQELYEAAEVDGANGFRKWLNITIPSLKPVFLFMLVMGTIGAFKRFGDVYMIGGTDGQPGGSLATLMVYIYRYAFIGFQFGQASAASFVTFGFIILFTLLTFRVFRERNS